MRVKVSIVNSLINKDINIQDVEFLSKYDDGLPQIYFKCDRKYEGVFRYSNMAIFHDKNGKEFFRSSKFRLEFRYYESDSKKNKVKFSVNALEFEELGLISKPYLRKILGKSCNAKVAEPYEEDPPRKFTKKEINRNRKYMDIIKSKLRKAPIYKYTRIFRYIYKQICRKFVALEIESCAPP